MSCAATRQGDEMYCSRCKLRWEAATPQSAPCLPERRTPRRAARLAHIPATGGDFDARALVVQLRGWVSSPYVLLRMEEIARAAYALGKKDRGPK